MKTFIVMLSMFTAYLWTDNANADANVHDDMVEFCGAVLLVTGEYEEFAIWVEKFSLQSLLVRDFQTTIEDLIKENMVPPQELHDAKRECIEARAEWEQGQ